MTIRRILIANRGEIAARIIRTCRALRIETVLAVSEADRDSVPAALADRTVCIGPSRASESYLNAAIIVQAALGTQAAAVKRSAPVSRSQPVRRWQLWMRRPPRRARSAHRFWSKRSAAEAGGA